MKMCNASLMTYDAILYARRNHLNPGFNMYLIYNHKMQLVLRSVKGGT